MPDKTEREKAQANIAENRKAFHDFHLLETFEAGIMLLGTEAKAISEGRVNLRDSFARVEDGEVYLYNVNISPYSHRGYADHEPLRRRKLLLHRDEIRKLIGKTVEKGMTLVPTRMYFKKGRVKVAVSLAKGKKEYDKRETIKRREAERETRAALKGETVRLLPFSGLFNQGANELCRLVRVFRRDLQLNRARDEIEAGAHDSPSEEILNRLTLQEVFNICPSVAPTNSTRNVAENTDTTWTTGYKQNGNCKML